MFGGPAGEFVAKWVVSALAMFGLSFLFGKKVRYQGFIPVIIVALIIAPAHLLVPYLIPVLHLPQPDSTLTHFSVTVVLYAALIYGVSVIVPEFEVENFAVALALAGLMAGVSILLSWVIGDQRFSLVSLPHSVSHFSFLISHFTLSPPSCLP